MANSKTTLKKGDNLPARGKSKKNLILDMLRAKAMLGLKAKSTNGQAEQAFFECCL